MTGAFPDELKVIVCAGTGGVGKTTVSAALGAWLAQEGKKTLVLTIDPAKRLAQAMGIQTGADADVQIADPRMGGRLYATMLNPHSVFDRFVHRMSPNKTVAQKLLSNHLYQQLVTNLTGSQEFTSLEKLLSAVEDGGYDIVILDTPPTQNAVDFLRAPQRIFALFQDSVTKWFVPGSKKGLIAQIVQRGTKTVLGVLERVTGSQFIHELSDFFEQMSYLQGRVKERSQRVHDMLTSEKTAFVIVTSFDELKLQEAMEFQQDLKNEGYRLHGVVVNRCFPEWSGFENDPSAGEDLRREIQEIHENFKRQYVLRFELSQKMQNTLGRDIPVARIPEMTASPQGLDDLLRLSAKLKEQWKNSDPADGGPS